MYNFRSFVIEPRVIFVKIVKLKVKRAKIVGFQLNFNFSATI